MSQDQRDQEERGQEGDWFDHELSRHELPEARESFKSELRDAFLSGEIPESRQEHDTREVFRDELRTQFVRGKVQRPTQGTARRKVRRKPRRSSRTERPAKTGGAGRLLRFALPLTAAAALLLTFLPAGLGGGRSWEVLEVVPDVSVLGAISDWQEIHTGKDRLRLGYGDHFFVEIGAKSRVKRVANEDDPVQKLTAAEGSLVFTSLPDEEPISIILETPDAAIQISSNSVAIDIYEGGTCICVLEGEVTVSPRVGEQESVKIGPGRSCFATSEGELHSSEGTMDPAHGADTRAQGVRYLVAHGRGDEGRPATEGAPRLSSRSGHRRRARAVCGRRRRGGVLVAVRALRSEWCTPSCWPPGRAGWTATGPRRSSSPHWELSTSSTIRVASGPGWRRSRATRPAICIAADCRWRSRSWSWWPRNRRNRITPRRPNSSCRPYESCPRAIVRPW